MGVTVEWHSVQNAEAVDASCDYPGSQNLGPGDVALVSGDGGCNVWIAGDTDSMRKLANDLIDLCNDKDERALRGDAPRCRSCDESTAATFRLPQVGTKEHPEPTFAFVCDMHAEGWYYNLRELEECGLADLPHTSISGTPYPVFTFVGEMDA